MHFSMIDSIVSWEKGARLQAVKTLSLSEEYLADHFPDFPVMPGVLMLEAMIQAGEWLMRLSDGFARVVYHLKEVSALRYANFVRPGDELRIDVRLEEKRGDEAVFKGTGRVSGKNAVVGRFVLAAQSLKELDPRLSSVEEGLRLILKDRLTALMDCERSI